MLLAPGRVVYPVSNLQEAKAWYSGILEAQPVLDSPFAVAFKVGEAALVLAPAQSPEAASASPNIVYWKVADLERVQQRLLAAGAKSHTAIRVVLGSAFASVSDPFGNILGVMGHPPEAEQRSVAQVPSETAMSVAMLRAMAALDAREEIRGQDTLAELFLTAERRAPLQDPKIRQWILEKAMVPGLYEFLIARTAYFDDIVKQALEDRIEQLVLLGAGYDSRPYRLLPSIHGTRIFEVDSAPTQQRKRELLQQRAIAIPPCLSYLSTDFASEPLQERLIQGGFNPALRTQFIWEGVIYYLPEEAVRSTLASIRLLAAPGSRLSFDYLSPQASTDPSIQAFAETMRRDHVGEPIRFRIDAPSLTALLAENGFSVHEQLPASAMEQTYLILKDGTLAGHVPPMFSLITAHAD